MERASFSGVSLGHFETVGRREGGTEELHSPGQQLPECSDADKRSGGAK